MAYRVRARGSSRVAIGKESMGLVGFSGVTGQSVIFTPPVLVLVSYILPGTLYFLSVLGFRYTGGTLMLTSVASSSVRLLRCKTTWDVATYGGIISQFHDNQLLAYG